MTELILAIDVGTTNVKSALFDPEGNQVAVYKNRCDSSNKNVNNGDRAENWWGAVLRNINKIPDRTRKRITAVSIIGQGPTIVPLNVTNKEANTAITWLDNYREESIPDSAMDELDPQLSSVLAKLLWLQDNIDGKYYLLQPADFVAFKLTGKVCNMSVDREGYLPWNDDMLQKYNLAESFDIPKLISTGNIVAPISKEVANQLRLTEGAVVVAGAPDFVASLVGTGTVKKGYLCDRGGTSQGVTLCSSSNIKEDGLLTTPYFIKDFWKISGIMKTTGKSLDWFSRNVIDFQIKGQTPDLGSVVRPTGLLFLPYLNGERSPYWDPQAKGVFFGLDLEDTKHTMLLAIMEGIAFGVRDIVERMEQSGAQIKELRVTGGQASNHLLNQIKADVLGKKIHLPKANESELLGATIFALSATTGRTISKISKEIVEIEETFHPDLDKHSEYSSLFELYRDLYSNNAAAFKEISKITDQ